MLQFLIIYALFLFAVACFLRVRIQVHQRYNNFQIVELLSQGARICRTFPTPTFVALYATDYDEGKVDYYFCARWHGPDGRVQRSYSDRFLADAQHEEVNNILRSFLKFVEDHQTYA